MQGQGKWLEFQGVHKGRFKPDEYEGSFRWGQFDGEGKHTPEEAGFVYEGYFSRNKRDGRGKLTWMDNSRGRKNSRETLSLTRSSYAGDADFMTKTEFLRSYEGQFKKDQFHGRGTLT